MEFYPRPHINKVPGEIHRPKDHAVNKDLTKLSRRELLDLKSRQEKLLENKSRLQKLPDKGKKIQDLLDRVVEALDSKKKIDAASEMLSALNLGSNNIDNLEWEGRLTSGRRNNDLDSDDDDDPIAILTSSNSTTQNQRILKSKEDEVNKSLITEADLKEIKEVSLSLDPVLEIVCKNENMDPPSRFLLNRPIPRSPSSSSSSLSQDHEKKPRDNSAATPPVCEQGVKPLSIRESIELEHKHQETVKKLKEEQAAERLAMRAKDLGIEVSAMSDMSGAGFRNYREPLVEIDENEGGESGEEAFEDADDGEM